MDEVRSLPTIQIDGVTLSDGEISEISAPRKQQKVFGNENVCKFIDVSFCHVNKLYGQLSGQLEYIGFNKD